MQAPGVHDWRRTLRFRRVAQRTVRCKRLPGGARQNPESESRRWAGVSNRKVPSLAVFVAELSGEQRQYNTRGPPRYSGAMAADDLPPILARRLVDHDEALHRLVRSGTRLCSGFATSEPHRFYATLPPLLRHAVGPRARRRRARPGDPPGALPGAPSAPRRRRPSAPSPLRLCRSLAARGQ